VVIEWSGTYREEISQKNEMFKKPWIGAKQKPKNKMKEGIDPAVKEWG